MCGGLKQGRNRDSLYTMNKKSPPPARRPQPEESNQMMVWIGTGVAVLVILGIALGFSAYIRNKNAAPVTAMAQVDEPVQEPQTEPVEEVNAPEPVMKVEAPAPQDGIEPLTPVEKPAPVVPDGAPQLMLDKIAGKMKLSSGGIMATGRLNLDHTCYRRAQSMPVLWSDAPGSTKSYVLIMEEHKPGELPFVKWLVFNIPADSKGLPAALPQAEAFEGGLKQGRNDHGTVGYTGPCIPKGQMNYKLRLFALDTVLDVPPTAKFENMIPVMNGHIVDAVDVDFFHYFKL